MIEHDIALLNDSFERCTARSRFLDRFYDLFLASSRESDPLFTHEIERVWRRRLEPGIECMRSQY
jgi:hypothetical protein